MMNAACFSNPSSDKASQISDWLHFYRCSFASDSQELREFKLGEATFKSLEFQDWSSRSSPDGVKVLAGQSSHSWEENLRPCPESKLASSTRQHCSKWTGSSANAAASATYCRWTHLALLFQWQLAYSCAKISQPTVLHRSGHTASGSKDSLCRAVQPSLLGLPDMG